MKSEVGLRPKLPWDLQMLFFSGKLQRAGPRQVSPLGVRTASREAGDASADNNFCMSPLVYSVLNSFPSIISFDAQRCPCEGGRTDGLISIFLSVGKAQNTVPDIRLSLLKCWGLLEVPLLAIDKTGLESGS